MPNRVNYDPFITDLSVYIDRAIKKSMKELQTCIPAIVKKVIDRNRVVVSPAIKQTNADNESFDWADIELPIYTPVGNKAIISFPVAAGDSGFIIAGDLDTTLFNKDPSKPARQGVYDRHNYQYGFFVPNNFGRLTVSDDGLVIQNKNTKIIIKDNQIEIQGDSALKINANSVSITSSGNNITIDGTNFKNHTHAAGTLIAPNGSVTGATGGVN